MTDVRHAFDTEKTEEMSAWQLNWIDQWLQADAAFRRTYGRSTHHDDDDRVKGKQLLAHGCSRRFDWCSQ